MALALHPTPRGAAIVETALIADDFAAAVPDLAGTLSLDGLDAPITIHRDALGIPHLRAKTRHDAFFGQGFVLAQDRLWQMDLDRHQAYGRSAELLGPSAVDNGTLNAPTRAMRQPVRDPSHP